MSVAAAPARTEFYLRDEPQHAAGGATHLGFWVYLMSDTLIFAVLFATYAVLGASLAASPSLRDSSRAATSGGCGRCRGL